MSKALRSSGEQLRSEGNDTPAKLIDGAAQRVDRIGSYLRDSNSNRILGDAEILGAQPPLGRSRRRRPRRLRRVPVPQGLEQPALRAALVEQGGSLGASEMYSTRELSTGTPPGAM